MFLEHTVLLLRFLSSAPARRTWGRRILGLGGNRVNWGWGLGLGAGAGASVTVNLRIHEPDSEPMIFPFLVLEDVGVIFVFGANQASCFSVST